jgi:transmembrane sensor
MSTDHLSDDDYDRLARYVSGEASNVERAEIERWVGEAVERQRALAAMQLAWRTPIVEPTWNVDAAWSRLSSGLAPVGTSDEATDAAPVEVPSRPTPRRGSPQVVPIAMKRRWWHDSARVMQVAATAVVLIGGALLLPRLRSSGSAPAAALAVQSFTTAAGERETVRLPDGSTVVLGVSSTLRTRAGYGEGAREVELEGEALFTVEHDEARPFRVIVDGTVVEDLGTEFAIRSYGGAGDGAAGLRVAVSAGSVAVRRGTSADTAVVLQPSDVATVSGAGEMAVSRGIDVSPFTAFATGRLIFVDTPFRDVVNELERWYGIEVRVSDDALLGRLYTATFERESLDEVLRTIALSLDVRFERDGNEVEFMAKAGVTALPQQPPSQLAEAGA